MKYVKLLKCVLKSSVIFLLVNCAFAIFAISMILIAGFCCAENNGLDLIIKIGSWKN